MERLWAHGYFVCTTGDVTDEVLAESIEKQDVAGTDDDFKVTG